MFNLTEGAKKLLDKHFSEQTEIPPIRVYMAAGCGGPQLGLALDEQKDTDDIFNLEGYTFLVDKSLMQTVAPITIDGNQYGFKVSSQLANTGNEKCASCSSC